LIERNLDDRQRVGQGDKPVHIPGAQAVRAGPKMILLSRPVPSVIDAPEYPHPGGRYKYALALAVRAPDSAATA
jgi:hypothetical protein